MNANSNVASRSIGWYFGWNIVVVCILAQIPASGLPISCISLFVHAWSSELHTPISSFQLALAPLAITFAFISPFIGALADKKPARWLIGTGLLLMVIFIAGISVVRAFWQFALLYGAVLPVGMVMSTSIAPNALVSRWFVRRLGLALGLSGLGISLGGVLLPPLVGVALVHVSWRIVWAVAAFITGGILLLVLLVLRDRPNARDGLDYVNAPEKGEPQIAHPAHANQLGSGWREILRRPAFWRLIGIYLPILAIYTGTTQNLAPIAANHGFGAQTAGMLIALLSLMHVFSTVTCGILSDRFGNRLPFFGLALLVATGALTVAFSHSLAGMAIGVGLAGIGGGFWTLLAASFAVEFGANKVGQAFGLAQCFLPINAIFPYLVARIQEGTGSYTPAMMGLAALACVSAGLALFIRERRPSLMVVGLSPSH